MVLSATLYDFKEWRSTLYCEVVLCSQATVYFFQTSLLESSAKKKPPMKSDGGSVQQVRDFLVNDIKKMTS